ncbi:MAG TPA: DNA polymerase III subunit alpha, partial [Bacteroidia bacterium]|nr:DNA polymerase III subunit alpha [Bacteroidia bacterium]
QFYFKTQAEMEKLFSDIPEALDFTNEIVDKVETLSLKRNILLPHYPIPDNYKDAETFLRHLTFEGARKKYGNVTAEIEQRLNFELGIITQMGFAGYFLIVSDFIDAGKKLGVLVGPGRGSAAGSAVAYSIGITNIDPLKYNLLFERFLNPERITMPDIDTDFDDAGRQKVIDYVVEKYGRNQVAQIVTFGSMAAKSSIKDVARVMELPLAEANAITKLVPTRGIDLSADKNLPKIFESVYELRDMLKGSDLKSKTLHMALELEGSIRNSGIHASAIIIAPDEITNHIPVCTSKESTLLITQFEGNIIEGSGMLKMDFLGLKTLTIIKECLGLIRINHNIEINVDEIPLDDLKTIELFQRGDTVAVFQFEKDFARRCLREMKPTDIEDLIAMNALNRPGPMEFIPLYIRRKHQKEKIEYPHPLLEEILKPTYGIMVYQEQIMQAAQLIAGYSLGSADILRRAMGKKDKEKMAKEREKFVKGAQEKNNIPAAKANEIFDVMERFAEYGFNRSHSAAYAVVAFQTAYLKSHYPAEFMAAVLTNNLSNMDEITFFMDECKRMNIPILGPDINESGMNFTVNKKGEIRFGLAAVKGVGEAAVTSVLEERNTSGSFKNIFDFAKRVNSRTVNKKCFESLVCSGTFDCFKEYHRAQYFFTDAKDNSNGIEKIIRYGSNSSSTENKNQHSLFGDIAFAETVVPKLPLCEPWSNLEQLKKEKEYLGFYLSGHPLDQFRFELKHFNSHRIEELQDLKPLNSREVSFGGMITEAEHRMSKNGKPFGSFTVEDFSESIRMILFSEDYLKQKHLLEPGNFVFLKCKVQTRYNSSDVYELKILTMQLLQEVGARMAKNITLTIPLRLVSDDFLKTFDTMAKQHPGNCQLRFNIFDNDEKISLSMASRKSRVMLDKDLIDYLETIPEVKYHLNG